MRLKKLVRTMFTSILTVSSRITFLCHCSNIVCTLQHNLATIISIYMDNNVRLSIEIKTENNPSLLLLYRAMIERIHVITCSILCILRYHFASAEASICIRHNIYIYICKCI